jgi:hypothetical protein
MELSSQLHVHAPLTLGIYDRRLCGSQRRSGHCRGEKNLFRESNPGREAHILVALFTSIQSEAKNGGAVPPHPHMPLRHSAKLRN